MAVIEINDQSFEEKALESKTPVLLDLFADWCGPCKLAEPVLEELSVEYKDKIVIAKLDVDQNPATTQKLGVMSIPTTVLFQNGKEIGRQVGFAGKKAFVELLTKVQQ